MSNYSPFLILERPCDEAIDWVIQQIGRVGLLVVRTFDLHEVRNVSDEVVANCPCPHHGTEQCDCQMVILLVYGSDGQPVSIVVHGHNGQTWFSMVNTPQQRANPYIETAIRQALVPYTIAPLPKQGRQSQSGSAPMEAIQK